MYIYDIDVRHHLRADRGLCAILGSARTRAHTRTYTDTQARHMHSSMKNNNARQTTMQTVSVFVFERRRECICVSCRSLHAVLLHMLLKCV